MPTFSRRQALLRSAGILAASVVLSACAVLPQGSQDTASDTKREQDRAAILAMVGEFDVDFRFEETAALTPGYELKKPYHATATEIVTVLESEPEFISLQHILVTGEDGSVVKHWRQDWHYERDVVYRYLGPIDGHQTWVPEELSEAQSRGAWVQTVWQVDDSPRYQSVGRWQHGDNWSRWEGDETGRPLPRREWTKRDDYDVLVARNVHLLTPAGWLHEQDNMKRVLHPREGDSVASDVLARERGFNAYVRNNAHDMQSGYDYWDKTQSFWADVRAWWNTQMDGSQPVQLAVSKDERTLWGKMFAIAGLVYAGQVEGPEDWNADMTTALEEHTRLGDAVVLTPVANTQVASNP